MDAARLTEQLLEGFGSSARVTTRRAGLIYQVEIPAFLADGDPVSIFVRPDTGGFLTVTDLGQTCMRLSYVRPITPSVEASLEQIAQRHGLRFHEGQIFARVPQMDLFPTAMALAQAEAEAEASIPIRSSREMPAEQFRAVVREVLREVFRERAHLGFVEQVQDPEGLYPIDALVDGPRPLALAVIPSELDAERAVATRYVLNPELVKNRPGLRWVALPKDMGKLPPKTQSRIDNAFLVPMRAIQRPGTELASNLRKLFVN
ncbi:MULTISPECIES: DUF1828 domain-containing protein [Corallococcus]|uniref:DUF1828 domain-containing protein n=1 Tax=Corallococcus TaxID=83461 RepID=UPI001470F70A|nr:MULTISPECIES: DUF1828 domain-containing protein [Corallococcus]NNB89915.1 DUF1828 domain-containing protein [Corallococcus exiguus]NOK15652.1 DUF1828 domain-containing protein [Corallococcus carmarthensis]